jgi:hypothetical protein
VRRSERTSSAPDRDDVRALVAPLMGGAVDEGAFFRVAVSAPRGMVGALIGAVRLIARERQAGLGAFTYIAIHGREVGLFELRWQPFHVHRVVGHWAIDDLDAHRERRHEVQLRLDDRVVQLEAAAPGPDADAVIELLTSC